MRKRCSMANSMSQAKKRQYIQKRVADELAWEKKMQSVVRTDKYDQKIFNQGIEWYNTGLEISDAPENIRNNTNFVRGFEKGKRVAEVNNAIYESGRNFYFGGADLEQASEKMKSNPYFVKGYQDAMNLGNLLKGNSK